MYRKVRLLLTKLSPHFLTLLPFSVILIFVICFHEPLAKELHHSIRQSSDDATGDLTSGEPTEFGKHRLSGDGVADDPAALRDLFASVKSGARPIELPPGRYLIQASLALRSGTHLVCLA